MEVHISKKSPKGELVEHLKRGTVVVTEGSTGAFMITDRTGGIDGAYDQTVACVDLASGCDYRITKGTYVLVVENPKFTGEVNRG
jgi:hypothetical protein